jgi:hypothetical protein
MENENERLSDEEFMKLPENQPKWWGIFVIIPLAIAHFLLCTVLTLLVYPKRLRKKIYEYYAPWGWGKDV